MKRTLVLIVIILMTAGLVFANDHGLYGTPEGDWTLSGNRLTQTDEAAPRAKAWLHIPQKGPMVYEFTMRYESGGEDGHGGAGIHILADNKAEGKSWGLDDSWLLWVNYDENAAVDGKHTDGLSAVIYRSTNNEDMELYNSIDLNDYMELFLDNLDYDIPVKLIFYPDRGRLAIDDPRGESDGWYIDLPGAVGAGGSYVAVRTNSASVSFTSPDVTM